MSARLATSLFVSGLLRLAEQKGGFGAVLTRGDRDVGAAILLIAERGVLHQVLERLLQPDGAYAWDVALPAERLAEVDRFVARRTGFDPDCWVVELDVPSAERFAAQIRGLD